MSHSYDVIGHQTVGGPSPYGLSYVNDTFLYVTSQLENTVYGYSNTEKHHFTDTDACSQCFVMGKLL